MILNREMHKYRRAYIDSYTRTAGADGIVPGDRHAPNCPPWLCNTYSKLHVVTRKDLERSAMGQQHER